MRCRARWLVASALAAAAASRGVHGWTDQTRERIADDALRLSPPALRRLVARHRGEFLRGLLPPAAGDPSADPARRGNGSLLDGSRPDGDPGEALQEKADRAVRAFLKKAPIDEVGLLLGELCRLVADLGDPLPDPAGLAIPAGRRRRPPPPPRPAAEVAEAPREAPPAPVEVFSWGDGGSEIVPAEPQPPPAPATAPARAPAPAGRPFSQEVAPVVPWSDSPPAERAPERAEGIHGDFAVYAEGVSARVPLVFGGWREDLAGEESLAGFAREIAQRAGEDRQRLTEAYHPGGRRVSSKSFDDRSIPFAIAALGYSRAVTNSANALLYFWSRVGGDLSGTPYRRPPEPKGE